VDNDHWEPPSGFPLRGPGDVALEERVITIKQARRGGRIIGLFGRFMYRVKASDRGSEKDLSSNKRTFTSQALLRER